MCPKAVAYYRHSAQDKQENSIPIQREQVRRFAKEHGIEIIKEFADEGKSGLTTEGRDAFNEMINDYVIGNKEEFQYILVLDVSRWGRYQDINQSAYFEFLCKKNGKQVVYTSIGFPKGDALFEFLHRDIERYRSAKYSVELSEKVFRGCIKVAEQGYRPGGAAPYGLSRLLLDENRKPVGILLHGQRKSIQNQRVTLTLGKENERYVVNRIFHEFVDEGKNALEIAKGLNDERIPAPKRGKWNSSSIYNILTNESYTGTLIYNRTTQKLKSPPRINPKEAWIRKNGIFPGIITKEMFKKAQEILAEQLKLEKYSDNFLISKLKEIYDRYGFISSSLIKANTKVSPSTYARRFYSLDLACQLMFRQPIKEVIEDVLNRIKSYGYQIEGSTNNFTLNGHFHIGIYPSVPMLRGDHYIWCFPLNKKDKLDFIIGIPLSYEQGHEALGYLIFPLMFMHTKKIRISGAHDEKIKLYGYTTLDLLKELKI